MKPNKEDELESQSGSSSDKTFSIEEVEKHNKKVVPEQTPGHIRCLIPLSRMMLG